MDSTSNKDYDCWVVIVAYTGKQQLDRKANRHINLGDSTIQHIDLGDLPKGEQLYFSDSSIIMPYTKSDLLRIFYGEIWLKNLQEALIGYSLLDKSGSVKKLFDRANYFDKYFKTTEFSDTLEELLNFTLGRMDSDFSGFMEASEKTKAEAHEMLGTIYYYFVKLNTPKKKEKAKQYRNWSLDHYKSAVSEGLRNHGVYGNIRRLEKIVT